MLGSTHALTFIFTLTLALALGVACRVACRVCACPCYAPEHHVRALHHATTQGKSRSRRRVARNRARTWPMSINDGLRTCRVAYRNIRLVRRNTVQHRASAALGAGRHVITTSTLFGARGRTCRVTYQDLGLVHRHTVKHRPRHALNGGRHVIATSTRVRLPDITVIQGGLRTSV